MSGLYRAGPSPISLLASRILGMWSKLSLYEVHLIGFHLPPRVFSGFSAILGSCIFCILDSSMPTFFNVVFHFSNCLDFVVISKTFTCQFIHVVVIFGPIGMVPYYHISFQV